MNRYLVAGVVGDALAGRRVVVFSPSVAMARWDYRDVVEHLRKTLRDLPAVFSARVRTILFPSGGRVTFLSVRSDLSNLRADVFVSVDCSVPDEALSIAVRSHVARPERVVS